MSPSLGRKSQFNGPIPAHPKMKRRQAEQSTTQSKTLTSTVTVYVHPDILGTVETDKYGIRLSYIESEDEVPPLANLKAIGTVLQDSNDLPPDLVVPWKDTQDSDVEWAPMTVLFYPKLQTEDHYWINHYSTKDGTDQISPTRHPISFKSIYRVDEFGVGTVLSSTDSWSERPEGEEERGRAIFQALEEREIAIWNDSIIRPVLYMSSLAKPQEADDSHELGGFNNWIPGEGKVTIPAPKSEDRLLLIWLESIVPADETRFATVDRSDPHSFVIDAKGQTPKLWYDQYGSWTHEDEEMVEDGQTPEN